MPVFAGELNPVARFDPFDVLGTAFLLDASLLRSELRQFTLELILLAFTRYF